MGEFYKDWLVVRASVRDSGRSPASPDNHTWQTTRCTVRERETCKTAQHQVRCDLHKDMYMWNCKTFTWQDCSLVDQDTDIPQILNKMIFMFYTSSGKIHVLVEVPAKTNTVMLHHEHQWHCRFKLKWEKHKQKNTLFFLLFQMKSIEKTSLNIGCIIYIMALLHSSTGSLFNWLNLAPEFFHFCFFQIYFWASMVPLARALA